MGTLTLEELKEEVRAGLGKRTDLDTRLTRILNLSQQRIARLHDFDEMESISVSVFPYTGGITDKYIRLPLLRELHSFKAIETNKARKLRQLTQRLWNQIVPASQEYTRGTPRYYTIWANTCVLNPLADKIDIPCEIWWTRWPTPFLDTAGEQKSEYKEKDEILIELSLTYAYNSLGKQKDAQEHWERAKPMLMEAMNTDMDKPDLDVMPGPGSEQLDQLLPSEYWNDPFMKQSP